MLQKMNEKFCEISNYVANKAGDPIFIVLFPIFCALWLVTIGHVEVLTLALSIVAITLTQMVLQSQKQETELNKLQMAEIIRAMPEASNELVRTDNLKQADKERIKYEQLK